MGQCSTRRYRIGVSATWVISADTGGDVNALPATVMTARTSTWHGPLPSETWKPPLDRYCPLIDARDILVAALDPPAHLGDLDVRRPFPGQRGVVGERGHGEVAHRVGDRDRRHLAHDNPGPPIENGTRRCTPGGSSVSKPVSLPGCGWVPVTSWPTAAISSGETVFPNGIAGSRSARTILTSELSTGDQVTWTRIAPSVPTGRARSVEIGRACARGVAVRCSGADRSSPPSGPR